MFLYKWEYVLSVFHTKHGWPLKGIAPSLTSIPLFQNGQGVFPSDLQTLHFDLSDMHSPTSKIREDMAFQM
jgi:hypothetical protein